MKYQIGNLLRIERGDLEIDDLDFVLLAVQAGSGLLSNAGDDHPIGVWISRDDGSSELVAIAYQGEIFTK